MSLLDRMGGAADGATNGFPDWRGTGSLKRDVRRERFADGEWGNQRKRFNALRRVQQDFRIDTRK